MPSELFSWQQTLQPRIALDSGYIPGMGIEQVLPILHNKQVLSFDAALTSSGVTEVKDWLLAENWRIARQRFKIGSETKGTYELVSEQGFISLEYGRGKNNVMECSLFGSVEDHEGLLTLLRKAKTPSPRRNAMHMLVATNSGLILSQVGRVKPSPLRQNHYNTVTLEQYTKLVEQIKTNTLQGRLIILEGLPGSGKTYLIRGLLDELSQDKNIAFVYSPSEQLMGTLAQNPSEVLRAVRDFNKKRIIFIIEDADRALVERQADNMSSIEMLLNMTAGLIGDIADLTFICSTNAKRMEIDEALLRPGRLGMCLSIGELTQDRAQGLLQELGGDPGLIVGPTTLARVYESLYEKKVAGPIRKRKPGFT